MVQIGKDFYEDLTEASFAAILDAFARGEVPTPGPQNGRFAADPKGGNLTLVFPEGEASNPTNASVALALVKGDTVARILDEDAFAGGGAAPVAAAPKPAASKPAASKPATKPAAAKPAPAAKAPDAELSAAHAAAEAAAARRAAEAEAIGALGNAPADGRPQLLSGAPEGGGDDLKLIKGVGPKLKSLLNGLGVYHFAQIAAWTEAEIAWVDDAIVGFSGRVSRDNWVDQAKILAAGGETEFSARNTGGGASEG
jgi:NADH-quinone oxidoreductase subunit E